ncbi:MAG: CHC2 zinc finger domain-containing protein [Nitrospirota bacterium]
MMIDAEIQETFIGEILNEFEAYYYKVEMPKVRQKVAEFKQEMGDWGKCKRLSYLYDRLFEVDAELEDRLRKYKRAIEDDSLYIERALIASRIPEIEKEIKKLETEIGFIVHSPKSNKITPEMIERAREYPFENLVEVKKGMGLCPFHDDHNPSMGIKNNYYHCFGCGAKGDVISFVMKRDGLSFKDAVKMLSSTI